MGKKQGLLFLRALHLINPIITPFSSSINVICVRVLQICLRCRRRGHRAKNCPEVQDNAKDAKYCYNCGETGHSLSLCPHPLQEGLLMRIHFFVFFRHISVIGLYLIMYSMVIVSFRAFNCSLY